MQAVVLTVQYCYGKCHNGGLNSLMEIIQYNPNLLTPLTEFYNEFTVDVPHCYPVKEEDLEFATSGVLGKSKYYDKDDFESEIAYVALQDGNVKAFIHSGMEQDRDDNNDKTAHILFFGFNVNDRQAGHEILKKTECYFQSRDVTKIYAYDRHHRYPCYHFAYAQLSDTLGHVQALLGDNDYRQIHGQAFFDWENFKATPTPPKIPVTLSIEWYDGRGKLPNCNITAYKDGKKVGVCWCNSGGRYSSHPDAQDWVYTDWIGVEDDYQGQGIGKYLLQFSLQESYNIGYRHASLSTDSQNIRAFLLYGNCGYRVVDWTYGYSKNLNQESGDK